MFWTVIKSSGLGLTCGHDRAKDGVFFISFSESTQDQVHSTLEDGCSH